ncbi:MAG: hypothetical protein AB1Z22_12515 [Synechococcaceae cyanobacterium]
MTATLPAKQSLLNGHSRGSGDRDQKPELRARIIELENQARAAADDGAIEQSARAILAALDCERRLAATGPQVLQLIKPRS